MKRSWRRNEEVLAKISDLVVELSSLAGRVERLELVSAAAPVGYSTLSEGFGNWPPTSQDPPMCHLQAFKDACGANERVTVIVSPPVFKRLYDQVVFPNDAEKQNQLEVDGILIRKPDAWGLVSAND